MTDRAGRDWTIAAAASLLAAVVHTWPLASAPGVLSMQYHGDALLNEWIVAWIQHQLPRAPFDLFEANIFYPARRALAFSEPLILPALLGYPIRLLGGSPVLVHNLLLIGGFALSMLAGYLLVFRWTGDRAAGLVAGSAFAFNTHTLARIEHLQAAHAYGLPLAVLAADQLIVTRRWRYGFALAAAMSLLAYTSGYLAIFGAATVAILLIVRIREWLPAAAHVISGFALAAVAAAIAILPLYLPYRRAAGEHGMQRSLENVAQFSATVDGYLASYGRLHDWLWNAGAVREFPDAFFPGMTVIVLALMACTGRRWPPGAQSSSAVRILTMGVLCSVGAVLSLGTRTPVYGWLYAAVPPLSSIRAAGRFGILFLFGMAVLAGFGLSRLRDRIASPRRSVIVAAVVLALVHTEALRAPFRFTAFEGIPAAYTLLATMPDRVVLVEAPFYAPEVIFQNAEYVFNSTAHWRPLMNGYSGYTPGTYREYAKTFRDFPDPGAIDAMRAAGATHLMLHPQRYGADGADILRQALADPRLERLAVGRRNLTLFRIR